MREDAARSKVKVGVLNDAANASRKTRQEAEDALSKSSNAKRDAEAAEQAAKRATIAAEGKAKIATSEKDRAKEKADQARAATIKAKNAE